jgi:hypothetical protein
MHGDEACATNSMSRAERVVLRGILIALPGPTPGTELTLWGHLIGTLVAREQEADAHGWG